MMTNGREMASDGAAEFLARVVPWPEADKPGYVNSHWRTPSPSDPKKYYWGGKPVKNVDDFLNMTKWALEQTPIIDIYLCLSLQSETGKTRRGKTVSARSKANALLLKSIWLDVDIKEPPKGYLSLIEAVKAVLEFAETAGLPKPSALIGSGGGLHVYWISDRPLTPDEWRPYAEGLKAAAIKHGLRCDAGVTSDCARILRVPGTFNSKTNPPKPVKILGLSDKDYDFAADLSVLPTRMPIAAIDSLEEGIGHYEMPPLDWTPLVKECAFICEALKTGGKDYSEPLWNLTTLLATFLENGEELAHKMGNQHSEYTPASTNEKWERKLRDRQEKGLGWPHCKTIHENGCTACATCPHFGKIKSPLNLAHQQQTPPAEPSFVDPYAEFAGPEFPLDVLPPTLARFVDAEHRAMGADPSAIAMAALTTVAGAMNAETRVRAGEGWWERPILWTALLGLPSTMKSPIIDKATKPLARIDHERAKRWQQEYAIWQQNQK